MPSKQLGRPVIVDSKPGADGRPLPGRQLRQDEHAFVRPPERPMGAMQCVIESVGEILVAVKAASEQAKPEPFPLPQTS